MLHTKWRMVHRLSWLMLYVADEAQLLVVILGSCNEVKSSICYIERAWM